MKLKYKFVVKNVAGSPVAVAVGKDNERFNGMIRLNDTGEAIFNMLNKGEDVTVEDIARALSLQYDISENSAKDSVERFVDTLSESGLLQ